MASETDVRIARAVALKAAVDLIVADKANYSELLTYGEAYARWLLDIAASDGGSSEPEGAPVRQRPASARSDPGEPPPATPPDEWPEDEAIGPPRTGAAETRHCGSAPEDSQGCGARLEWKEGVSAAGKDYAMWACPNKKKTNDPAEQAAENRA